MARPRGSTGTVTFIGTSDRRGSIMKGRGSSPDSSFRWGAAADATQRKGQRRQCAHSIDLTNADMMLTSDGRCRATLHLCRTRFLWQGTCYERIRVHNYGVEKFPLRLMVAMDADFADLFEARGRQRLRRGWKLKTVRSKTGLILGYKGLDETIRRTYVRCTPAPKRVMPDGLRIEANIPPHTDMTWEILISCEIKRRRGGVFLSYDRAHREAYRALQKAKASDAHVYTSNEQFNHWLNRSMADSTCWSRRHRTTLSYAGVLLVQCPVRRDGIITALQMLDEFALAGSSGFSGRDQQRRIDRNKMRKSARFT